MSTLCGSQLAYSQQFKDQEDNDNRVCSKRSVVSVQAVTGIAYWCTQKGKTFYCFYNQYLVSCIRRLIYSVLLVFACLPCSTAARYLVNVWQKRCSVMI